MISGEPSRLAPPAPEWLERPLRWRQAFGGTLVLTMVVATFVSTAIGVLAPFIVDDLGITRAELGVLTTVLAIMAAITSPPMGRLVDDVGGRVLMLGEFVAVAVALVLTAIWPSYPMLVLTVAVAGAAQAASNPATNKLVSGHIPQGRQGVVVGLKQSGSQFNAVIAGATLPVLASWAGWRLALSLGVVMAAAAFIVTILVLPAEPRVVRPPRRSRPRVVLGPAMRWLAAYAFSMSSGTAAVMVYLPLYAHESVGLDLSTAGLLASTIGVVAIVTRVMWGRYAETARSLPRFLAVLAALSALSTALFWAAAAFGSWLLWAGVLAFGASASAWSTVLMLIVLAELPHGEQGQAAGMVFLAGYRGLVVTPIVFGLAVDAAAGSYGVGWFGVTAFFVVAIVVASLWAHRSSRMVSTSLP